MRKPRFLCITPTYDRPEFLEWSLKMWDQQRFPFARRQMLVVSTNPIEAKLPKGAESYVHGAVGVGGVKNLVANIECGVRTYINQIVAPLEEIANHYFVIWEDDDYYAPGYLAALETILDQQRTRPAAIGFGYTPYFNINNGRRRFNLHPGRSSFCATAVRADVFHKFSWEPGVRYPDVELWEYLNRAYRGQTLVVGARREMWSSPFPMIGIKHGRGTCLGAGHRRMGMEKQDAWGWLDEQVESKEYVQWLRKVGS